MSVFDDRALRAQAQGVMWSAYFLATAGMVVGVGRLFQPGPPWTSALLGLAPLSLAAVAIAPELFEFTWRGGNRRINPYLAAPALFAMMIGLAQQVESYVLPLAGALVGAGVFLALSLIGRSRPGIASPLTMQFIVALAGAGLGYATVAMADVDFDKSTPVTLQVTVLDKYTTHGRSSTGYHLRLPPFAMRTKPSSISVSSATYTALNPGDQVCVLEHAGALGLPWFTAKTCGT
jgi:hypothetical protein